MKKSGLTITFFLLAICLNAATVDTISIYSSAMQKSFKCVVIKPEKYKKEKLSFPVVYLLHGHGGWYANLIVRMPQLKEYADEYCMIFVCPDGNPGSWYLNSPVDPSMKFETYISKEVPDYIDRNYNTIKDRRARAISGISMGGHGALYIAFRHSEFFGACGSISGVVALENHYYKYDINKRIRNYGEAVKYSVSKVIEQKTKDTLAIIFDCGLSDPFLKDNRLLHEKMVRLKIAHDYIERPGNHDWTYNRNSIEYHLLFFRKYFGNYCD